MYSDSGQLEVIEIGLIHALVLTVIIYAIGYSSDAQVNPAVTIALSSNQKNRRHRSSIIHNTSILP